MPDTTQFMIGDNVNCTDGACGVVNRVVIDPVARTLTHLVVEPNHREGHGRLVPLDLVETLTGEVRLRCTLAEYRKLDVAEETRFLPGGDPEQRYAPGDVLFWPHYVIDTGMGNIPEPVTIDNVPLGEVEVRRGEQVHAADGVIGQVKGLVIGVPDCGVTHLLLQEGHLWGRKEVAIPIGAVMSVDDGIHLSITKQQVKDLPPIDVKHPR